jgi:hypothetical protein
MNYTKPEVAVLGEAANVIEILHVKELPAGPDGVGFTTNPAYDLDE